MSYTLSQWTLYIYRATMEVSKRKIAASVIILEMLQRKKKKRSVWVRDWILRRENLGAYSQLMSELSIEDPSQFSRSSMSTFNHSFLSPIIN